MKDEIIKAIQKVTSEKEINLEVPEVEFHGDYATNVAMNLKGKSSKIKGDSSRQIADEIVKKLNNDSVLKKVIEKIEVAGPGFINFWLKNKVLIDFPKIILKEKGKYGSSKAGLKKTVIVEYSSPNIAKPLTIGHLRSTIIGDAIANLFQATGWKVYRDNHLGDWGTQFGKQIYAIKTWGDEKNIEKSKNPVRELVSLYVKFHEEAEKDPSLNDKAREWFKKLEDGDEETRRIWENCVAWSWVAFDEIYGRLGIKFSKEFNNGKGLGEAFFEDKMDEIINELKSKKLLKEGKEGAKLVFFEKDKYPPAMILKKDGTTLYHTRDLATDKYRRDQYDPYLIINEVGSEQTLYFQQLFEMEKLLGWFKEGQRVHVGHGLFRFKDKKMSTRKGGIIWLEDVLNEAVKKAKELGSGSDKLAETVGIGALKWNDLKRDPKTNIVFDWEEILKMQGNSGPYLQYTFARTQSVLRKAKSKKPKTKSSEIRSSKIEVNDEEASLLRSFIHFPEVVEEAAKKYAPNLLCNYLYDLAQKYNAFYNKHRVIGSANLELRLKLTAATGKILKNGLTLLGIDTPEKM